MGGCSIKQQRATETPVCVCEGISSFNLTHKGSYKAVYLVAAKDKVLFGKKSEPFGCGGLGGGKSDSVDWQLGLSARFSSDEELRPAFRSIYHLKSQPRNLKWLEIFRQFVQQDIFCGLMRWPLPTPLPPCSISWPGNHGPLNLLSSPSPFFCFFAWQRSTKENNPSL